MPVAHAVLAIDDQEGVRHGVGTNLRRQPSHLGAPRLARPEAPVVRSVRVALYARVSTPERKTRTATDGSTRPEQDPEVQLTRLREYAASRGWVIVEEYVDRVSGSTGRRPQWEQLLQDAHRRRFDTVAIWKLDRAARSVSHLVRSCEVFGALGVDFVSLTEAWDTTTPQGRLIFHVLAAVAEFEHGLIAERTRAGIAVARQRNPGRRWGRRPKRVDLAEAQRLMDEGMAKTEVARRLGVGRTTLYRALDAAAEQESGPRRARSVGVRAPGVPAGRRCPARSLGAARGSPVASTRSPLANHHANHEHGRGPRPPATGRRLVAVDTTCVINTEQAVSSGGGRPCRDPLLRGLCGTRWRM